MLNVSGESLGLAS